MLAAGVGVSVVVRAVTFDCCGFPPLFFGTFALPSFLGHFALGLAACRLRTVPWPGLAALAAVPLIAVPFWLWTEPGSVIFGFDNLAGQVLMRPMAAAGFALLILSAASAGVVHRVLGWAPFRRLGDVSYSLYLIHIPLQVLVNDRLPAAQHPLGFVLWATAASLAGGALLYALVERPAERWRHRRKLRLRVAAASTASPPG